MTDCGIYRITHVDSGKSYVGQSVRIHARWEQHKRGRGNSTALAAAITKYGLDSFQFEVLEYCSPDRLNDREVHWIEVLKTMSPHGYNLNSGGNQPESVSFETRQRLSQSLKGSLVARESRKRTQQGEFWKQATSDANRRKAGDVDWQAKNKSHLDRIRSDPRIQEKQLQEARRTIQRVNEDPDARKKNREHLARLNQDPELRARRAKALRDSPALKAHLEKLNQRRSDE